ncbi:hypothetical protein ABT336_12170 [Micromonospora sp. NPDC000207]|uniref:hypothetical protein n=1 Tax=Micromonospora sp. NPDC000207 TaxID=3154246 RepID=UPI0033331386
MTRPAITIDPAVAWGGPAVRGIGTVHIAGAVSAGDTVMAVAADYGLTRHEVLLACWWEGTQGEHRQAWQEWAEQAHQTLGGWTAAEVDAIPDPPTRTSTRESPGTST